MKITLTTLSLLALLGGCQSRHYQPPATEQENTATITFHSDNIAAQPVVCVADQGFKPTAYALAHRPHGSALFDQVVDAMKKSSEVTTTVLAQPDTVIGVHYNRPGKQQGQRDRCQAAVRFSPQQGQQYQAHFSEKSGHCGLTVSDQDGGPVTSDVTAWQCP